MLQEAAAFDVPSVVVRDRSSAEGFHDGLNGFLVENEVASLATKLSELIENRDAVKKAGEGARKTIYHPWETIVDDVYLRYADIIRRHQPVVSKQADDDEEE